MTSSNNNVLPRHGLRIENVVCTASIVLNSSSENVQLSLPLICIALQGSLGRFPAVVSRSRDPRCTISCFASGKIVIVGCASEGDALLSAWKFVKRLNSTLLPDQQPFYVHNFAKVNLVGCCNLGVELDLNAFKKLHHESTIYEPELFPGLAYRAFDSRSPVDPTLVHACEPIEVKQEARRRAELGLPKRKNSFVFFKSGCVLMIGNKDEQDLLYMHSLLRTVLEDFVLRRNADKSSDPLDAREISAVLEVDSWLAPPELYVSAQQRASAAAVMQQYAIATSDSGDEIEWI